MPALPQMCTAGGVFPILFFSIKKSVTFKQQHHTVYLNITALHMDDYLCVNSSNTERSKTITWGDKYKVLVALSVVEVTVNFVVVIIIVTTK